MVKLDDLGADWRSAAVWHHQSVEFQYHRCMAFDLPGHIDLREVAVNSGILIGYLRPPRLR